MSCSAENDPRGTDDSLSVPGETGGDDTAFSTVREGLTSPEYGTVTYLGNIPSNKSTSWFKHPQGVALGRIGTSVNMFFSVNDRIYGREAQSSSQFGVSQDLPTPHWDSFGMPDPLWVLRYNHFGDIDFVHTTSDDIILAPVERDAHDVAMVAALRVVNDNALVYVNHVPLIWNNGNAPWIAAYKPDPSFILSSQFDNVYYVTQYHDSDPGPWLNLDPDPLTIPLTGRNREAGYLTLNGVQGGEFNAAGELFLIAASGPEHGTYASGSGVYAFRFDYPSSGIFKNRWILTLFDYYPAQVDPDPSKQEFEGITVGKIDPPGASDLSYVHAIMRSGENVYFKHWTVSQNAANFALP